MAAVLALVFVADAASHSVPTIAVLRSNALSFLQLYGFVLMFIFAVSLRTFPIFFQRRPAQYQLTIAAWVLANAGVALYAAALIWKSYDHSADVRLLQTVAFLVVGVALVAILALLRIFEGRPHRLRDSARRSMRFIRSAYAWLLLSAVLQVFFSAQALLYQCPLTYFQTGAVRHFLALGFVTTMIIGMALLVLSRLAMKRAQGRTASVVALVMLILLHGSTAARGVGSLLVDEARIETGFWTMTAGGLAVILAMAVFAAYLLWPSRPSEISLSVHHGDRRSGPLVL